MANSKLQVRMPFTYHLLFFSFVLFHSFLKGQQNLCFDNVNTFNGQLVGAAYRTVVDSENNVYSLGSFQETVTFGTGEGQVLISSAGGSDTYLSKYDADGNFIWVKQFGSDNSDHINQLEINGEDDLFISGSFKGTMDFNPGIEVNEFTSGVKKDLFLIKLDRNGDYQWSVKVNGDEESYPTDLKLAADGSILLNASVKGIQDINPGSGTTLINEIDGGSAQIKLDENGQYQWHNQLDASEIKIAFDDNNNILVSGKFSGTVDFDAGAAVNELVAVSIQDDAFILKLSGNGDFNWVKQISGASNKQINDITCDHEGNVLYTGYFSGVTDFDPGIGLHEINSSNGADAFMTKLDADGEHLFTKDIGVVTPCLGEHIAVDIDNDIYMSGFFNATMDFDPGAGEFLMTNSGYGNHFLVKLSSNGAFMLAKQIEGDMPLNGNDLEVLEDKRVIISGGYNGTVDFDPGEDTFTHTTPSGNGYVLTWYQEHQEQFTDLICDTYQSPSGNYIWEGPGTYFDTVVNEDGCTTVYEIELYAIDTGVQLTNDENSLIADQDDAKYQWYDCDNNLALEGKTGQSFTPSMSGNYSVEIMFEGCTQTSECTWFEYNEITTGTDDINAHNFSLYPNPTSGDVTIELQAVDQLSDVCLYSVVGSLIECTPIVNSDRIDIVLPGESGIYIIELNGNERSRKRIVKL